MAGVGIMQGTTFYIGSEEIEKSIEVDLTYSEYSDV